MTSVILAFVSHVESFQESLYSVHVGLQGWTHQSNVVRFNQLVRDHVRKSSAVDICAHSNAILEDAHLV
jgi:hypothetical protein